MIRSLSARSPLALIALLALAAPAALAQDCQDYGDGIHWLANCPLSGDAYGLAVVGSLVYVGADDGGLHIVDITDPAAPAVLGGTAMPGGGLARMVAVAGSYAYVDSYNGGIHVVDVTSSASPSVIHTVPMPSYSHDVEIAGGYLYVTTWQHGLQVVDIATPASAGVVATFPLNDSGNGMRAVGNRLYVAGDDSLYVLDVSTPTAPALLGQVAGVDYGYAVDVVGDHAYVAADDDGGLCIFDVSDPAAMTLVGQWPGLESAYDVVVDGGLAFVADAYNAVWMFDVTDPTNPELIGTLATTSGSPFQLALATGLLCVTDDYAGLALFDLTTPQPILPVGVYVDSGMVRQLGAAGHYLYLPNSNGYLDVLDVADPANPVLAVRHDLSGTPVGCAQLDHFLYTSNGWSTIFVVNINYPAMPNNEGMLTGLSWSIMDMVAAGDNLYVIEATEHGLQVLDVSDRRDPQYVTWLDLPTFGGRACIEGDHLYVANASAGLQVVDIATPASPSIVGSYDTFSALDVAVTGTTVLLLDSTDGMLLLDVSDPTTPALLGQMTLPGDARAVTVSGDLAYVALDMAGVAVVDISDPAAPAPVGQGCYADDVNGILATRNNVFVASGMGNLLAYRRQCGDPSPVYLAAFDLAADGGEVRAAWSLAPGADDVAFRLAARRGEESWEVPVRQVDAGHWEAVDDSPRLQQGGTVVYSLACRSADGAWRELDSRAIDVAAPALLTALTAVSPNPFNPQTEIAFAVDAPQRVVIAAYDLSGRLVARLTDRVYPAGPHTIRWDGRDDRGRAVASGTYLLRLEGRGTTDLRKLMLVR